MIDRKLYLAYLYLYKKLLLNPPRRLSLASVPRLNDDGHICDFSVNLYKKTTDGDVCEMHFHISSGLDSIIVRLEDVAVHTWSRRIDSDVFENEQYEKIHEIVLEHIVSAVNKGWVKLDRLNKQLLNDLIEHDLVYIETVQAYKLTEYSKRK